MKIYVIVSDNDEYGLTVLRDWNAYATKEAALEAHKRARMSHWSYVEEMEVVFPEENHVSNNT
jgi:hypothetical protein